MNGLPRIRYELQFRHPAYGWIAMPSGCQPTHWQARTMKHRLAHFRQMAHGFEQECRLVTLTPKVIAQRSRTRREQ